VNSFEDAKRGDLLEGCYTEPQFLIKTQSVARKESSVNFIAEADDHGLFEIRFHRLAHLSDRESSDSFPSKQIELDREGETETHRSVVAREAMLFFQKFASCSFYYNEVNKASYNVCPAFYKFKIQPFHQLFDQLKSGKGDNESDVSSLETDYMSVLESARSGHQTDLRETKIWPQESLLKRETQMHTGFDKAPNERQEELARRRELEKRWNQLSKLNRISRVFEVEEYMGDEFIEELARLH